jgi:uncharacterized protein with von Willebrand factor type A (vWA) domain
MSWNPVRTYLDWRATEREADRQLIRDGVSALSKMFEAQLEQSKVVQKYLDSFNIVSPPEVREWDEVADAKTYLERSGRAFPEELKNLNSLDQLHRVLAKMDRFEQDLD